jgi:small subunit ribosomal protein S29
MARHKVGGAHPKNYKKKRQIVPVRKPEPGARKAFRKRIQLSNDNAVPVEGLEVMTADNLGLESSAGSMLEVPDAVVDQLRAAEAFKSTQRWSLFRKPHTLVTAQTVTLMNKLRNAVGGKDTMKMVLVGDKVTGKSMMLLQAMAYAFLNDWIVINIPEGPSRPSYPPRVEY